MPRSLSRPIKATDSVYASPAELVRSQIRREFFLRIIDEAKELLLLHLGNCHGLLQLFFELTGLLAFISVLLCQ